MSSSDKEDLTLPYGKQIVTGSPNSVLASLFRIILQDNNITAIRFDKLLRDYVKRTNPPTNMKDEASLRGNLKKELLKSIMTWNVFVKGLTFLNVTKFEVSVKLYHFNNKVTEHKRVVELDYSYAEPDEKDRNV